MRNRSNSGVRLDYFQRLINKTILKHQNAVTGLFPASETNSHAWVRDNVYSIMAVWGLSMAYRKTADLDEDRAKSYELEQRVVKLMRGLLQCMMMQIDKLEKFKKTQSTRDSLHAKYCSKTCKAVVGDDKWGHLQIDATSLYLLTLAQMTASGLQVVYTLDEVAFVQNLVFYIESAYRTPDYGIWERGDKTNHGFPELNSSSIGMAKAALEAINELDLLAARGGPSSVIHVLPDEAQQCQAILHSMLPRESSSKEIDAALMSVISFPAFAVDDGEIIENTRKIIQEKLEGNYGFCRFLRDGYKTAREDPNRLHYEPWELQVFENLECQWPMFFAYFILDGLFSGNSSQVKRYRDMLDDVIVKAEDGIPLMPELYAVPGDKVEEEYKNPRSQKRNAIGKLPQMWGQSLFILGKLINEGFISPGELDPLNRRLVSEPKPDIVVQVVILAEDSVIQYKLSEHGVHVQLMSEVGSIQVFPARVLTQIYSYLGKNSRLGLSGRPSNEIGLLATSKLYMLNDQIYAFIPQFMDEQQFYLTLDTSFTIDLFRTEVAYLKNSWKGVGRPTLTLAISHSLLDTNRLLPNALIGTIKKLQSGYIAGTRVHLGDLSHFLTTSCVTKLSFATDDLGQETTEQHLSSLLGEGGLSTCQRPRLLTYSRKTKKRGLKSRSLVSGIVRRSRSIQVDAEQIPALHASLRRIEKGAHSDGSSSNPSSPGSPIEVEMEDTPSYSTHLKSGMHLHHERACSPVGSPMRSSFLHETMHSRDAHQHHQHDNVSIKDLMSQLEHTEVLQEQADIVHYLFLNKGLEWEMDIAGKKCSVKELLVELYEKAGHWKQWWLVRHTAGMLHKRVEDLALAATDMLVRQKQLSVGLPPDREKEITRPLPPEELATIIYDACGEDLSTASLTQELLIYLAMFIRTEPKLLKEMLRLRVGLIIQVMASELARTLKCSGDEASDHLLNLSPFEMKTLLHHILSGKEFVISSETSEFEDRCRLSVKTKSKGEEATEFAKLSRPPNNKMSDFTHSTLDQSALENDDDISSDRQGQWLRRRRLDGSLNRVPVDFYPGVWKILSKIQGLSFEGHFLPQSLTKEMTAGEFKFALRVEMVLNSIPQPEYRQLMVEALMVLTMLTEGDWKFNMNQVIHVDKMVQEANKLFINDQKIPQNIVLRSQGAAGICLHLYDSAPSGRYGTMAYLCRALASTLNLPCGPNDECVVS